MSKANQAFKQNEDAVSPVIGVILMVAITVVLAAVVFVLVTKLASNNKDKTPELTFDVTQAADDGVGATLTIVGWSGPTNTFWSSFSSVVNVNGSGGAASCTSNPVGSGMDTVSVGDQFDCRNLSSGEDIVVVYKPTNNVALKYAFK